MGVDYARRRLCNARQKGHVFFFQFANHPRGRLMGQEHWMTSTITFPE
jgi:hypothetical protein